MHRRAVLATGGLAVGSLAGCLESAVSNGEADTGSNETDDDRAAIDVILYNYRAAPVRVAVDVVADGDSLASRTVELAEPSTVSTTETVATVPSRTNDLTIGAAVEGEATERTDSFELPFAEPTSAIEIRTDEADHLEITPLADDQPQSP